ncbi:MAG: pyridoxal phosphate-dependent aminotransferase [Clostridiales bacterium]|nr:pyridoxal phosphate-dependent aminotransferase [Clostridiales bacterium]
MKISKKAQSVPASMTLEISAKVKELKSQGKSIIGFTAGEPDFNTPEYIINSAKEALDKGLTKYTPVAGMVELKDAIVKKFKKDNNLDYEPSQIVVSDGAKASLFHAIYAMVDEGDEVIIPAPFWFTYEEQVKLAGGIPVIVQTKAENGYKITSCELEDAITDKTVAIIINSPSNPTGALYNEDEFRSLSVVIEKHGLAVISDEIYEKLIYDGQKHVSIASISPYMKENTVVINGVSKTYAMTGWRIGYLAAPKSLASAINRVQGHSTSNACSFAQYASITALNGGEEVIEIMRKSFDDRRKYMISRVEELGLEYIKPQGAFYMFIDISKFIGKSFAGKVIDGSMSFASILTENGVAVIPGLPFHADNFIRASYAVSLQDIKEGFDRIKAFINNLV